MKRTLEQLNDEFGTAPTSTKQYEVGGKKYVVVSHYAGSKNIDKVIRDIAIKNAYADMKKTA